MEPLKALTLTIICSSLVIKGLSFYYTVIFTELSTIKAIYSSFHRYQQSPRDALKYFSESRGKHLCQSLFFIKLQTSGLEVY